MTLLYCCNSRKTCICGALRYELSVFGQSGNEFFDVLNDGIIIVTVFERGEKEASPIML